MKRLFIENAAVLSMSRVNSYIKDLGKDPYTFFDKIITNAFCNSKEVWESIKEVDEIYTESSLIDMFGTGGGTLFNAMMYRAIEEKIEATLELA